MLAHFFSEETAAALLEGPMGLYLPRLAVKLLELEYSQPQARKLLRTAASYGQWLQQQGVALADAGRAHLEAYDRHIGRLPSGHHRGLGTGLHRIAEYLQPWGILCRPDPPTFADPWLLRFDDHLRTVRGLAPTTRRGYARYIRRFILSLCDDRPPDWSTLGGAAIARFLQAELAQARAAKKTIVAGMRTFLRFLVSEGLIARGLLRAIPRVRSWRYANLPEPLSVAQHETVLRACQAEASGSLRDRAFVALLAQLGVRGGELRQLCLADINWSEGVLHIRHSKSGRDRTLPLPAAAGALLAAYLRQERPPSPYREVFLTAVSPRRPLQGASTTYLVSQFLRRAGLTGPRLGTHCFRHTAATLMVRHGATLKEVADVLGHRSIATTGLYVKLDQPSLAGVALPWIGGDR